MLEADKIARSNLGHPKDGPQGKVQGATLQSNPVLSLVRASGAAINKKPRLKKLMGQLKDC
ncbi:hypothetical protein GCM10009092_43160 [Bowmanella denitrificans]|uniref:Uncharacterized protein n=1 Tax=Bowmanella denitrificans TaxID=366582 RepID=A0ABN0XVU1_9ALTE